MKNRTEHLALFTVGLILLGLPVTALGYQHWLRPTTAHARIIDIEASAPESGGFDPDAIRIATHETVTLRFTSTDVTHGVAIGPGLGIDLGHVDPGQVEEITLTFDHPGTYTYYCTTWCSADHWRMRGTIQVIDPDNPGLVAPAQLDPVIERLIEESVDIDAVHNADQAHGETLVFERQPSAEQGEVLVETLVFPTELTDRGWRRTHTPMQAVERLAAHNPQSAEADLRDVAAYLWTQDASIETLLEAEALYNQNCAACHGQYGGGDGPAAITTAERPVAFADPAYMFEMRSDVLYAKIRRGGMGTDMPNFGTLFTQEETWALVEYLWTLPVSGPS
jgi:mono/diheme cytochrome c family protein/plastocyanin